MDSIEHQDHPDRELLEMLQEAEAKVEQLRVELDRRREFRRQMRADEAHEGTDEEVERLSEYLEQAQINWQAVRKFFQSAIEEYRADDAWGSGRPGA
ncbi:MAG: hypothetical protein Q4F53_01545 [Nesterenkonia sp.]|uniref:hypothetical protein n=1 Tax=Nesterenkonia marinintestina TaxID=2979865 RepID=UPI0021BF49D4|nr:hypothetical protein [Nesterenkonia sp. GX14115]MDO5492280.1 hypothetical protein [Nesterenkonia sp.]